MIVASTPKANEVSKPCFALCEAPGRMLLPLSLRGAPAADRNSGGAHAAHSNCGPALSGEAGRRFFTSVFVRSGRTRRVGGCPVSLSFLSTLIRKSAHVFLVKPLRPTPSFLVWLIWLGVGSGRCG